MKTNPSKCYTLALKRFDSRYNNNKYFPLTRKSYSHYNPNLYISGTPIKPITHSGFKYLGVTIEPTTQEQISREKILQTISQHMSTVHDTPLAKTAKLFIYNHHIIPRLSWWFTTLELSLSFAKHLHKLVLPYLKKWCGLPRSANTFILFCGSKSKPGLKLKRIPTTWKQCKASMLQILRRSRDPRIRALYNARLLREEARSINNNRYAPCVELECALASAPDTSTSTCANPSQIENSHDQATRAHVASYIHEIDTAQQLNYLSKLQMQGCWSKWDNLMNVDFSWKKLTYGTSNGILRFLLNSATNTLPTPDNLRRLGCLQGGAFLSSVRWNMHVEAYPHCLPHCSAPG